MHEDSGDGFAPLRVEICLPGVDGRARRDTGGLDDEYERNGGPRGRPILRVIVVGEQHLHPSRGVTLLAQGDVETDDTTAFLKAFLWGGPAVPGALRIGLDDGREIPVAYVDGTYSGGESGELTWENLLTLLGVRVGDGRLGMVGRVEMLEEGMGRCQFSPELADGIGDVVYEVIRDHRSRRGCEICAPLWLIDLGLRLCMGEKVVIAEPRGLWRPTMEMLSRREVQAIVVVHGA
jgi:hypothetical protein